MATGQTRMMRLREHGLGTGVLLLQLQRLTVCKAWYNAKLQYFAHLGRNGRKLLTKSNIIRKLAPVKIDCFPLTQAFLEDVYGIVIVAILVHYYYPIG